VRPEANTLFEISWEVCNKTTNLYELLKSKSIILQKNYENYYFVGPYIKENQDFTKENTPKNFREIFLKLEQEGINCHYGKWNINGEPSVILVESNSWPEAPSKLIEEFQRRNKKTVAHFHNKSPKETKYPSLITIYNNQKITGNENQVITTTSETHKKRISQGTYKVLIPGINNNLFPKDESLIEYHKNNSRKLKEFIIFYFFPFYRFNLEETITTFINLENSQEIIIKALKLLENKLQNEKSNKTLIAILYNPEENYGTKENIATNKTKYKKITKLIDNMSQEIIEEITKSVIEEKTHLLPQKILQEINRLKEEIRSEGIPPISAQRLREENNNKIIKLLEEYKLNNSKDSKVKVILFSNKLNSADGIINLNEEEVISGCELGIFLSEDFNALKCSALGTPCLTSEENSLGDFLISSKQGKKGVYALKNSQDMSSTITKIIYNFTLLNKKAMNLERIESKKISKQVDWENIIHHYIDAHNKALKK